MFTEMIQVKPFFFCHVWHLDSLSSLQSNHRLVNNSHNTLFTFHRFSDLIDLIDLLGINDKFHSREILGVECTCNVYFFKAHNLYLNYESLNI